MTVKNCIFCNKSIKANRPKSSYCSNSCKQKNYKLKKSENDKEVIKENITNGFLREQQINGFFFIQDKLQNSLNRLEENKRIRKEQDEYIKEQKEFQKGLRALELKRIEDKNKIVANYILSALKSKISALKSNDIKSNDIQLSDLDI